VKTQLLVPAAGAGVRLGTPGPKALTQLAGKPLIVRTLERFASSGLLSGAVIVTPSEARDVFAEVLRGHFGDTPFVFTDGGAERQDSVANGLEKLEPDTDVVVVHDAARPFVPLESVEASVNAASEVGAATVAVPSVDTVLVSDDAGFLADTPDRRNLWVCQTPQTFQVDVLRRAYAAARKDGFLGTDDASLARRWGGKVKLVMGSRLNFKITTPADMALAECLIRSGGV